MGEDLLLTSISSFPPRPHVFAICILNELLAIRQQSNRRQKGIRALRNYATLYKTDKNDKYIAWTSTSSEHTTYVLTEKLKKDSRKKLFQERQAKR